MPIFIAGSLLQAFTTFTSTPAIFISQQSEYKTISRSPRRPPVFTPGHGLVRREDLSDHNGPFGII